LTEAAPRFHLVISDSSPYCGTPCHICGHPLQDRDIITLVVPNPSNALAHQAALPLHLKCLLETKRTEAE
jgi:hypothetical protein